MSQVRLGKAIRAFRCFSSRGNRAVSNHQTFYVPQPVLAVGWGQVMLPVLLGKGGSTGVSPQSVLIQVPSCSSGRNLE